MADSKRKVTKKRPLRGKYSGTTPEGKLAKKRKPKKVLPPADKPLPNRRHEDLIQEYLSNGFKRPEAYQAIYGTEDRIQASKLCYQVFVRPEVKARLKCLYHQSRRNVLRPEKEDLLDVLMRRISADITDYIKVDYDEDGKPQALIVPTDLMDGQVIDEISIVPTAFGDRVKIKMPDKEKAIDTVAKIQKIISNDANLSGHFVIAQDDAANEAYRRRMEKHGNA